MKITVLVSRVIDDLLAASALASLSSHSAVLSDDHRPALCRLVMSAAADVAAALAPRILDVRIAGDSVCFEISDDTLASAETLGFYFASALSFASFRLLAMFPEASPLAALSSRAAALHGASFDTAVSAIADLLDSRPSLPILHRHYL